MKTKPFLAKTVLTLFFTVFASTTVVSQTLYALRIDRNIRSKAADITAAYQPRLVMGTDQALQFQQVVAKFLVKRKAIEKDRSLSAKARYELLKNVSSRETSAMADVLESYRWQEYMRIKPEIQPVPKPGESEEELIVVNPRHH